MPDNKMKWLVEFSVDPCWVADGFDLKQEKALSMLRDALPHARADEIAARIVQTPTIAEIDKVQGFAQWRGKTVTVTDCKHCDRKAAWRYTDADGNESADICERCMLTLPLYMAASRLHDPAAYLFAQRRRN